MKVGHYGRNPASLISKMESTSDRPGGHNLLCCCGRPADFRWGPGLGWETRVSVDKRQPLAVDALLITSFLLC